MGIMRQLARFSRQLRTTSKPRRRPQRRAYDIEKLEARCPLAADVNLGVVYYEDSLSGNDNVGDTLRVTWNGGADGTQLTRLAIHTDKQMTIGADGKLVGGSGDGLTIGDTFFDTAAGGRGVFGSSALQVTSSTGFTVNSVSVEDGGSVIVFTFSGFDAGEVLELSIDVDEVGFGIDNAFVEGAEFQGSILDARFEHPDYFAADKAARFFDDYSVPAGLNLPPDSYSPPNAPADQAPLRTAAGFVQLVQAPKPSSIKGRVHADRDGDCTYDTGEPLLAGVQIDLLDAQGNVIRTTTTNANGEYLFDNLLPGTYGVREHQPAGYFDGGEKVGTAGGTATNDLVTQIVLGPNVKATGYDFCEKEPSSLKGRVYVDSDQNGVRSAGDPPIANVTLELVNSSGTVVATTTTNAAGEYAFNNLPPGTYSIREVSPAGYYDGPDNVGSLGGTNTANDVLSTIVLIGNTHGVEYNFGELLPASIRGRVHADRDGDCTYDSGEPLIAGVTVQLLDAAGNAIGTTTTNANGEYAFNNLRPGIYGIREIQPAGYFDGGEKAGTAGGTVTNDKITAITLGSGVHAVGYDFCEKEPSSIRGRVYVDSDQNGVRGAGDPPIANVTLQLLSSAGAVVATTTTNAGGEYAFNNLPPGTYSVREVQPAGYYDGADNIGLLGGVNTTNDVLSTILLIGNTHGVEYNFGELLPASISGNVHADRDGDCEIDPGEPMIEGVVIQLLDAGGNVIATTQTDAAGNYKFENLRPGTYGIRELQPAGYFDGGEDAGSAGGVEANDLITEIHLGSGVHAADYNFCEKEPVCIGGYVYVDANDDGVFDSGEAGIGGATVHLLNAAGAVIDTTTSAADGSYGFCDLPPGTYGVSEVQPAGYYDGIDRPGDAGGTAQNPGDRITGAVLTPGVKAKNYNFGELLPGSIRGNVHADEDGDCIFDPEEQGIEGVTIELLDVHGSVIATTLTNANGDYAFTNLAPGTYGIREVQPVGYFDSGDRVGTAGGAKTANDLITSIVIGSGVHGLNYNFCEIPPSSLSGYVFQDGPEIIVEDLDEELPPILNNLAAVRPGIRDAGDRPLAGITLYLADADGNIVLDASDNRISTVTDGSGFYRFDNLRAGSYSVVQQQPGGYYDGIDTPGSTGGVSAHPGDLIQGITLGRGDHSVNNNFSEVAARAAVTPFFPINDPNIPPFFVGAPADRPAGPVDPLPVVPLVNTPPVDFLDGSLLAYTWHLSVVNAGRPRGERNNELVAQVRTVSESSAAAWIDNRLGSGRWLLQRPVSLEDRDTAEFETVELVFGADRGIPVTGDFNGDGITDVGLYVDGEWFIDLNGNGTWDKEDLWAKLGYRDDMPVTGDWDGDGKTDIGIFGRAWPGDPRAVALEPGLPDPDNPRLGPTKNLPPAPERAPLGWRVMQRTSLGRMRQDLIDHVFHFGVPGDRPLAGDWNGDGVATIGVFRDGRWDLDSDGDGRFTDADLSFIMGAAGDKPVVGDFDGDGVDEIGIYRDGEWHIDANGDRVIDSRDVTHRLGGPNDYPAIGDWDGDGIDEIGVYQPSDAPLEVAQRHGKVVESDGADAAAANAATVDEIFSADDEELEPATAAP